MASRQERPLRFNTGCTYMYTLPLAAWLLEVESPLVASTCMRLTYFQLISSYRLYNYFDSQTTKRLFISRGLVARCDNAKPQRGQ